MCSHSVWFGDLIDHKIAGMHARSLSAPMTVPLPDTIARSTVEVLECTGTSCPGSIRNTATRASAESWTSALAGPPGMGEGPSGERADVEDFHRCSSDSRSAETISAASIPSRCAASLTRTAATASVQTKAVEYRNRLGKTGDDLIDRELWSSDVAVGISGSRMFEGGS